jgi:hypothetical protein
MRRPLPTSTEHRRPSSRRGAAYVLVIAVTSMIGVISYAALTNVRVLRRDVMQSNDSQEATWLAFSGMENAIARINNNSGWRTTYTNNVEISPVTFGRGTFSWRLVDTDGNLADDTNDAVRVIATGKVGPATRVFSQELRPGGQGFDVLQTAVHSSGNLEVNETTIWGGRFSSNATLTKAGTITGNGQGVIVQGISVTGSGALVNGSSTTFSPAKPMPASTVFDLYKARATTINYWSIYYDDFDGKILSATSNPWGDTNAEGIYFVKIPSGSCKLVISNSRIKATLLVEIDDKGLLELKTGVIWEPPAPNYPSMIAKGLVAGKVDVMIDGSGTLDEASAGCNFNPPGFPYRGSENTNTTDTHMPLLRGLFHVIRLPGDTSITDLKGGMQRKGCFLIEGAATIKGSSFMNDPKLFEDAPQGYIAIPLMRPAAGTAIWEAAP